MAEVINFLRIKPLAYNWKNFRDNDIVDGEHFSCNKPFLIISSKPIPTQYKTYVEFTITYHPSNPKIRFVPIYLGVHKEPSFGMLNSDFCIGTVYYLTYTENLDLDIIERYNAAPKVTHQKVHRLHAKIPIVKTVIGVGVDIPRNKITLYSDGQMYYEFSPSTFNMTQQNDPFYFAIYTPFWDEQMNGFINYGRYKTEYLPDGYWNLYQQYYNRKQLDPNVNGMVEIPCIGMIDGIYQGTMVSHDWVMKGTFENTIAPVDDEHHQRRVFLVHKFVPQMDYIDDLHFRMVSSVPQYYGDNKLVANPENIYTTFTNLPIPTEQKVYFEFYTQNGAMFDDISGMPVSVGISVNDKYDITPKSIRLNLWHGNYKKYTYHTYIDGVDKEYGINSTLSPSMPTQPNKVGVMLDLGHNQIWVYVDNTLFIKLDFSDVMDLTDYHDNLYYLFIQSADEAYYGELNGGVNFGEKPDELEYMDELDDDVMTLYEYYNYTIRYPIPNPPEWECTCFVIPYIKKYNRFIYCNAYVYGAVPPEEAKFSPGYNKLYDTYNTISDIDNKLNVPDKDIIDIEQAIKADEDANKRQTT